jgi:hypothetical protein
VIRPPVIPAVWIVAAATSFFLTTGFASAASLFGDLPVGKALTYHITAQSSKPAADGGSSSTDTYVQFTRDTPSSFAVRVNGAPAGELGVSPEGNPVIPQQLKKPLAPFEEIGLLLRGAPNPLAQNAGWATNVPVPLDDTTDQVTAAVTVTQFGPAGVTIVAGGQNSADVQRGLRDHPADVNFNAALHFNPNHVLAYANSNLSVVMHLGAFRTKHVSNSWTLSLAQ